MKNCSVLCCLFFSQSHACCAFSHFNTFINSFQIFKSFHTFDKNIFMNSYDLSLFHQQRRSAPNPSMFTLFYYLWLLQFFFSKSKMSLCILFSRPMVPQLAPPKIPEGERVDFDVSYKTWVKPDEFHFLQHKSFWEPQLFVLQLEKSQLS